MNNLTISVIGNQTLSEVLKELKLFSKYKIESYNDLDIYIKNYKNNNRCLIIYFFHTINKDYYEKLKKNNFPIILITKSDISKNKIENELEEKINAPIKMLELEKKIVSLMAKYEFKKGSVINLSDYVIDKNERKIKKNNFELQLTEKEINFLILFTQNKKPLTRNFILKSVWRYSSESDTHTIETHIHRLRKKILDKFGDSNFIKNNEEGYYI